MRIAALTMHLHLGLIRIMLIQMAFLTSVEPIDRSRALQIPGKAGALRDDGAGAAISALIGITIAPTLLS